jgi:hypothetical protein
MQSSNKHAALIADINDCIREGLRNATLIPWDGERRDANAAIAETCAAFEAAGWRWNTNLRQLEKGGWYAWFRSQGNLASPIIQWSPLSVTADSGTQFTLF